MTQPAIGTFADHTRPLADRVRDLLGQLTIDEKIALLHQHQAAIPRLNVGAFRTGTEALHGLAWLGEASVFPQAVGLAATWDLDLVKQVGAAVGNEVRASHKADPTGAGLNVWAPVVNPLRDPRWGRNEEGYSEDPYLTARVAIAYSGGLRGDHPTYLRCAPTLKHFLGYNNETDRDITSSCLRPRVLHEYEFPAFAPAIAAGAAVGIMASYNLVNGRPAHVSPLINDEVRKWTPDELLVVSDAAATSLLSGRQAYYPDHVTGSAAALRAGIDSFTEIGSDSSVVIDRLTRAFELGLIDDQDIDAAVRRILTIRFRLGEFDPPELNPFTQVTPEVINCAEHQRLARQAAQQGMVLLKNPSGLLPLDAGGQASGALLRIAVVGPLADVVLPDWYSGTLPYQVSARAAIAQRIGAERTAYAEGVDRVALREAAGNRYLTQAPDGALRLLPKSAESGETPIGFDIFDWGQGVFSMRSPDGSTVSVTDDGQLVANHRLGPNGWVVRETFRLVERGNGTVALRHQATGLDIVAAPDGLLHLGQTEAREVEPGTEGGTALGGSATAIVGGIAGNATELVAELLVDGLAAAVACAQSADLTVVLVGNHPMVNGRETEDRVDLELPAAQETLLKAVHSANPNCVLVVVSSYPFGIGWAEEHLPAVLWSSHGGQEFGQGLAQVLFGEADPSGRLPQTWYRSAADLPDLLDYDVIGSDLTYQYYRGRPLYPFGHGLSYTSFEYQDLILPTSPVPADGEITVRVTLVNTGTRSGVEVVQLYTRQRDSRVKRPLRQLQGFQRVELLPGEQRHVYLSFPASQLARWEPATCRMVVELATHQVMVGRSATNIQVTGTLTVAGEVVGPRDAMAGATPAIDYDGQAGTMIVPLEATTGDAVEAAEDGAWLAFHDLDFGSGATSAALRVRWVPQPAQAGPTAPAPESATLVLRWDNPVDGPVAGTTVVPATGDRYTWDQVPVALSGASGIKDLCVSFSTAGIGLSQLRFQVQR